MHYRTLILLLLLTVGCSSTPTTQYYALLPDATITPPSSPMVAKDFTLGVGPIVIPEMLDNIGIVSTDNGNQITLATYHVWAGSLQENISQVMADNLSNLLKTNRVWPYPWDNRNRPETQLRIVFERFSGARGKQVTLQAKWTLLTEYGRKELKTQKSVITLPLANDSYQQYILTLNRALNELSRDIADDIHHLNSAL